MTDAPAGIFEKQKAPPSKRDLFVGEFIVDLNGTQAAIRAGFSEKTARSQAHRLLKDPNIQRQIRTAIAERMRRTQIDADYVLMSLTEQVEAQFSDLFAENGTLKPVHEWPPIFQRGLVVGFENVETFEWEGTGEDRRKVWTGYIRKVKLTDRFKHLEAIGRHTNVRAFRDSVGVEAEGPLAELFRQGAGRVAPDGDR
jgi:phage terminase small subunit